MNAFPAIRIEGGLLGPDVLDQVLTAELPGQKPADFGLDGRRNLTDKIAEVFADARAHWEVFRRRLERLPEADLGTSVTRDAWMIPFFSLLDYELRYNPRAYDVDGASFAISHRAGENEDAPPVHIVGARQDLGRVAPTGRPRLAPHSLVQEYLNRTEQLWGIVTNGVTLRLLRDSTYIRRQAYVEFDLAQILEEQRFNDFVVLYRLLHRTRLPRAAEDAKSCLLEQYYQHALEQGGRVRERLRDGVEQCLTGLANGFLEHPENQTLRQRVLAPAESANRLSPEELYRQLLRLVYRFLFLLVSEDRGLISADPLYREHYGVGRLRRLLELRSAYTDHQDLWCSLRVLWKVLADERLAPLLGAAPLNGELFEPLDLDACAISNRHLLEAFWHLAYYQESPSSPPRRVNYAALDVEELGSVYESLLEYHPQIDASGPLPRFELAYGSERKTTGSYYTPPELVAELIRSALEPALQERLKQAKTREEQEKAILSLRVLDPACGSGHFLLAAARRLGKELARIRTGEDEPAPERVREAIREVVAHCIYGVDKNPLAVDLCRVALWLEAHCAGKPLTFLDHHIKCGDSLVGVMDLEVLDQGIPDEAFDPASADDKHVASELKKRNRKQRLALKQGQLRLPFDPQAILPTLAQQEEAIEAIPDNSPELVRQKKQRYNAQKHDPQRCKLLQACHLWTAAFFQRFESARTMLTITTDTLLDHMAGRAHLQAMAKAEVLALQHNFFHWPLEFPEVFAHGGFDVVLGNPPWERIKLQEQEFFAARDPEIANAPNAAKRKKLIAALEEKNPALWQAYLDALHAAESTSRFLRGSGFYPLTGRGDINTYSVFAERMRAVLKPGGRMGVIVPTGIATDDTNKYFFAEVVEKGELVSLYDFENRKGIFLSVHRSYKFCLLTLRKGDGRPSAARAEFAFFLHGAGDLQDPERRFTLTSEDFRLLNPNTRTAPIFRSRRDAELTKHIYRRVPVLVNEVKSEASNPWAIRFLRMFDMTNDSHLFRTRAELEAEGFRVDGNVSVKAAELYLPLYEAKMVHQFDHRFGDYAMQPEGSESTQLPEVSLERLADPHYQVLPRYWVPEAEVEARLRAKGWDRGWLLGWRDITNVTNERTVIAAVIPRVGVGHTLPLFVVGAVERTSGLLGCLSSFSLDFVARQKVGGTHLTYNYLEQLPVLPPSTFEKPLPFPSQTANSEWRIANGDRSEPFAIHHSPPTVADFVRPRVLELTYTAWDLKPFAQDLGYDGPPFRYDPERRFWLRAELDALFFLLYLGTPEEWEKEASPELKALFLTPRDAVAYILEQFPIVRRKDEERFGEYRTKRVILEIYDAMVEARRTGKPWASWHANNGGIYARE
ncbi:MAG: Eco57I restriction-modification methylase domain-containing protein [Acidobacteriota bacterium]